MLDQLRFVAGAVARKELLPAMSHFIIQDGSVRAYNGALALSAPLPFAINCRPKAAPLIAAIAQCQETIALAMTAAGKLRISSGPFKAYIDCIDEDSYHVQPEGVVIEFDGKAVLEAFHKLETFIGTDASRPWSNGILLKGQSAFATNNVIAAECWLGTPIPFQANVPRAAITEMLRINEPPTHAQLHANSISFHYADKRWIRSQLLDDSWPDMESILAVSSAQAPVDASLFDALENLKPFVDKLGRLYFKAGAVSSTSEPEEAGATVELPCITWEGVYPIAMLSLLKDVAVTADFSRYPLPCIFYGEKIRGAIVGMRRNAS